MDLKIRETLSTRQDKHPKRKEQREDELAKQSQPIFAATPAFPKPASSGSGGKGPGKGKTAENMGDTNAAILALVAQQNKIMADMKQQHENLSHKLEAQVAAAIAGSRR